MRWPWQKKQPRISKLQMVTAVPVRNSALEFEVKDGRTSVTYPPLTGWRARFLAFFFQASRRKTVELDDLGGEFLEFVDGQRQVQEIIGLMKEKYLLGWKEAEVSTLAFLRELGSRGIIGMVVKQGDETDRETRDACEEKS